ncbi:hypothetical protein Y032_0045g1149 [Ancylostoma ceylanicum]|uniref:Uncharacterized protein n=1 Tax=Ancylostoma ceylanicum TaxID=53326 RepID=A0A016UC55_9BILA|nr:hypothetical protein Y032_0045g1149 [Ancylostoma ceylanicum]
MAPQRKGSSELGGCEIAFDTRLAPYTPPLRALLLLPSTVCIINIRAPQEWRYLLSLTFLTKATATSEFGVPENPTSPPFSFKIGKIKCRPYPTPYCSVS